MFIHELKTLNTKDKMYNNENATVRNEKVVKYTV